MRNNLRDLCKAALQCDQYKAITCKRMSKITFKQMGAYAVISAILCAIAVWLGATLGGDILTVTSSPPAPSELYAIDLRTGIIRNLSHYEGNDYAPSWAPDGNRLVFISDRDGFHHVYMMDAGGNDVRSLTPADPADAVDFSQFTNPVWSEDGAYVYSMRDGASGDGARPIRMYKVDAVSYETQLVDYTRPNADEQAIILGYRTSENISPDGTKVVAVQRRGAQWRLMVGATGDTEDQFNIITDVPAAQGSIPAWSMDSQRIAFETVEDGGRRVYVVNVNNGQTQAIKIKRIGAPVWRP
jgi:TolB protein